MQTDQQAGRRLSPWQILGCLALYGLLYLPFANRPVHMDDANFLMLAKGAAEDPWRPHAVQINWDGVTEPAFGILANPPGIAWYLAPVRQAPEWVLHLWMQPWLWLGAWGCYRLGMHYAPKAPLGAMLFIVTSPVVVLSLHALTPDLPVFGCIAAGVGGFVTGGRANWKYALLAGCGALFRYSGVTMVPLMVAIGYRKAGWKGACSGGCALIPMALLCLHDWQTYGELHLLAMTADQNDAQARPWWMAVHNVAAGLGMLGGAVVLPVLIWRRAAVAGSVLGAGLGLQAAYWSDQNWALAIPTMLFLAAGVGALSLAASRVGDGDLLLWSWGGAAFFAVVRFAATRYWAAFVPGVALLAVRNVQHRPRWLAAGIVCNVLLSLGMAIDDQALASGYRDASRQVASSGAGTFGGHWGWQHYLEQAGWVAVERNGPPGEWHAHPMYADVQHPQPDVCLRRITQFAIPDHWWGPRIMSFRHHAWYHAGGLSSYVPWTFSDEPYDVITVYQRCDGAPLVEEHKSGGEVNVQRP